MGPRQLPADPAVGGTQHVAAIFVTTTYIAHILQRVSSWGGVE